MYRSNNAAYHRLLRARNTRLPTRREFDRTVAGANMLETTARLDAMVIRGF